MGDFQQVAGIGTDWTPNSCLMTQDATDTNLYTYTVNIPAFQKYEYKYINGDQSYEVEIVPVESQVGHAFNDNRWIFIDSLDADTTLLAPVMFGANAPAGLTMIRFLVDMTTSSVSANGVHVAGSFQGDNPATDRMYSFVNQVYEIMSYMTTGAYTYKFYNGNTTSDAETVPSTCAVAGNRTISLSADIVLNNVCFSTCTTCFPASIPEIPTVTFASCSPNPFQTSSRLDFNDGSSLHHIRITDMQGRTKRIVQHIQGSSMLIDRNDLQAGLYILTIENEQGERHTLRFAIY
jgi:hypothetical protein